MQTAADAAWEEFRALCASLTADQIRALRRIYPRPLVRPGTSHDQLLFEAGAASVVDAIFEHRRNT